MSNIHQLPLIRIAHFLCVVVLEDTDASAQRSSFRTRRFATSQAAAAATGSCGYDVLIRGLDARGVCNGLGAQREGSPTLLAIGTIMVAQGVAHPPDTSLLAASCCGT